MCMKKTYTFKLRLNSEEEEKKMRWKKVMKGISNGCWIFS